METETIDGSAAANTKIVQELYAAFARRDIDAILERLHADVEWKEPDNPFNPAAGTRTGHAGFLEWARIGRESEEVLVLEPRRFLAGPDMVAVIGYTKCKALTTGRSYETDFVHLITFRGDKIARFEEFFDTFAAGEAFKPEPGSAL